MLMRHACSALALCSVVLSGSALAQHGSLNPMAPRQLSRAAYTQDYSYGYSLLPGSAIDSLYIFNDEVGWTLNYDIFDHYVLRPIAHGYHALPQPIQTGVGNFTYNLTEVNNVINNLLIGKPGASAVSLGRFAINTTIGILGFIDVASMMGLEPQTMEMQTVLGKAGMEQGPFLMVPAYGPATGREVQGDVIDGAATWWMPWYVTVGLWAVKGVHNRAQLIEQEGVVDNAVNPYTTTRDIFLMYAEGKVNPDVAAEGAQQAPEEESIDEAFLDEIDG